MTENKSNIRGAYPRFRSKSGNKLRLDDFNRIVSLFMKFIMAKVFAGYEVKLPARLGSIQVVGRKVKPRFGADGKIVGLAPNWPQTKKLWESNPEAKKNKEIVYCFNEHSDGYRYRLLWSRKGVLLKNKSVYSFRLSRSNKRTINKLIKEGKEFYTE